MPQIALYLLEDVPQRRRMGYALGYGERKPVCLPGTMVRVLPEYHHAHRSERTAIEGLENILSLGMDSMEAALVDQKGAQLLEPRCIKGLPQFRIPVLADPGSTAIPIHWAHDMAASRFIDTSAVETFSARLRSDG
jgi:hypothetical protein